MAIQVRIPNPLQILTDEQPIIFVEAASIRELIEKMDSNFPGIKIKLCDETGKLRRFVNFYVNNEDIRFRQFEETLLKEGDEVSIVPAIAGG